jgi:transposase
MPRGFYSKVADADRQRLIAAYEGNTDWLALAAQLDIPRQTARSIILRYRRTGERTAAAKGGRTFVRITEQMMNFLVAQIEQQPTMTLKEMRQLLLARFEVTASVQTISKHLDKQLITLKKVVAVPVQWNQPQVKEERRHFFEWLLNAGVQKLLVFHDETGFNLWTARTRGRAARGNPAVRIVEGQRGKNVTVSLAVSPTLGLVHHKIHDGSVNRQEVADYISEVESLLEDQEQHVLLCDNAAAHVDIEAAILEPHEVRRLPRYSPFLNLAEFANSALKAAVKRQLASPRVQAALSDRQQAANAGVTLQQHRLRIMRTCIEHGVQQLTQPKCESWLRHLLQYGPRCLAEQDIFD